MAELEGGGNVDRLGAVDGALDESGAFVVRLLGEIDISNADAIGIELERLLDGTPVALVVDLSGLDFMDSTGIAMLLQATGRAGSVVVRNPSAIVRRMIETTGLSMALPVEEPVEE